MNKPASLTQTVREKKKIIMQSRNWLLRMDLTYQGLNSSMDEQRASLVSSQCTKLCVGGVIQETSAVTNKCPNYFLSSLEVVVAFHILLCRKHRQKMVFHNRHCVLVRKCPLVPQPYFPQGGQGHSGLTGDSGVGSSEVLSPILVPTTVGPGCCLSWLWEGEELVGAAVSTGWHSKQRHGCAAGIWDRLLWG